MKPLHNLIAALPGATLLGDGQRSITGVKDDSRQVTMGDLFVALPGTQVDGRRFLPQALAAGAGAILVQGEDPLDAQAVAAGVPLVRVPDVHRALGPLAARWFGTTGGVTLTAVTGTNGKTTTTYLLEAIFAEADRPVGIIGTVSYRVGERRWPAPLTTPGALELHRLLLDMKEAGATDVVLEASSIALHQGRLGGCVFRVAGLTNVTQDHLDYHGTMEAYFQAKTILFRDLMDPRHGVAALFFDQEEGRRMRAATTAPVLGLSCTTGVPAEVSVSRSRLEEGGTFATLRTPVGTLEIESALVGSYNLANIVLAVGMALGHGIGGEAIVRGIARQAGVPGRLERVENQAGVLCLVDYAHTPDALERSLAVLRPLTRGRLLVVFGCGGDRDQGKRPLMGEVAVRGADLVILTSDNPRTEVPAAILAMVEEGAVRAGGRRLSQGAASDAERGFLAHLDRRTAIRHAVAAARPGDTLLIAGKGHEDYQIVGTTKFPFDDRAEASAAFARQHGPGGPS